MKQSRSPRTARKLNTRARLITVVTTFALMVSMLGITAFMQDAKKPAGDQTLTPSQVDTRVSTPAPNVSNEASQTVTEKGASASVGKDTIINIAAEEIPREATADETAGSRLTPVTSGVTPKFRINSPSVVAVSGTKTIPGDYVSIAAAVTDINTNGIGAGGVTFNIAPGYTEIAPAGGLSITATGTAADQIIFQKDTTLPAGPNPLITASPALTVGALNDAIFKTLGGDYITFSSLTLQENPANTVTTAATNNMTEWGIALLYGSTTNGAQNNTIVNCTISLNRTYTNSFGIYSNVRHSPTAVTTTADITSAAGANSGNRVYGNTISNVNAGIVFVGSGAAAFQDSSNDIGGGAAGTGNVLTNWGGAASASAYVSVSGTSFGMYLNHQTNLNVQFNTLTSAAVAPTVTFRGIFTDFTTASPTGTFTNTISNNTITMTNAGTGAFEAIRQSNTAGTAVSTVTVNMSSNSVINCAVTGAASAVSIFGLANTAAFGTVNMNNNTVRGNTSTATTGGFVGVTNQGAVTGTVNLNNNKIGDATAGAITFSVANSGPTNGVTNSATITANVSISNNDIRGIVYNVASSASPLLISNTYAGSATANVNNNTFTNLNLNTTGSVTFIQHAGNMTATGVENCNSNSIVTAFNKGGAGGTVTFFSSNASSINGSAMTNNLNNFSNVTVIGATTIAGWSNTEGASGTSGPGKTITNNTFNNIVGGTGAITGMSVNFSGPSTSVSNNTFSNISSAGAITGLALGSSNQATLTASQNLIDPISTTGASAVIAITTAAPTVNISRNKIYDLSGNNAGTTVNGIAVTAGTNVTVFNNLIGDLRATAANAANPIIGINSTSTTTVSTINVFYNTIFLNASSTGTNFGSTGIFHTTSATATTAALNLRNNIIVNTSTPNGTGLTVAYRRSSTTLTNYAATSNNNDFYAGAPGASRLIFFDGTNSDQTITTYKARVASRDSASFTENPAFLSTTGTNANFLHIDPSVPTQIESGASPIAGITDDFDGQIRNVSTPDVGADEFAGIAVDLSPPVISYTNLGNGAALASRSFTGVTVTDASGVNMTAGTRPRVYYKKSTNANTFNDNTNATDGWKFAEANGAGGSPFNFTIDYSLLFGGAGVSVGDTIQYFVVAQDTVTPTPNVGINSGTFNATPTSVALTAAAFPIGGTINSYNIVNSITGIKTVCASGCDYTTLTGASGAFADINGKIATGNIEIQIQGDLTETGANALNQVAEEPAGSNFMVNIHPTGAPRVLSGTNAAALIPINGADRVTIDGSLSGGTDRSLTITNTNAGTSSAVILVSSGTSGAQNDTIKNVIVVGSANTQTFIGINFGGAAVASFGTDNDNNRVENCDVRKVQYGIATQGASVANKDIGTVITKNLMNNTGTNSIGRGAIIASFEDGIQITQNTIGGIVFAGTGDTFGISLGGLIGFANSTTSGGSEVSNAIVARNNIGTVQQTNTFSAAGIIVTAATTGTNLIANNFISGVLANGTSPDFGAGIFIIETGTDSTTQLYHNSVSMTGTLAGADQPQYALAVNGTDSLLDVRDNIFSNSQVTGTTSYAVGLGYSTFANLTSNYNDLFVPTTGNFKIGRTVNISSTGGTDQTTLANWQSAPPAGTGKDANSISANPQFASATDLHITRTAPATPAPVENVGTPIGAVTNDFDNDTRGNPPDIGADEVMTIQFSSPTYLVPSGVGEGAGTATITVTRTAGAGAAATVNFMTADGSATGGASCGAGIDYVTNSGTLNFAAGDTSKTFDITICDDSTYEGDETVNLSLSTVTGDAILGSPDTAVLTINENDSAPTFSIDDVSHMEGNAGTTMYTFTVTKTGATALTATVNFMTQDGTATIGDNDYQSNSGMLTFMPGDMTMPVTVLVNGDTTPETNETFTVHLSGAVNATISDADGTGTIENDDVANTNPTISDIPDQMVSQDNSVTASFTVNDAETPAANLTLTGSSNNQTLVPDANITFGGSGANRTVTVTPAPGQNGMATITVTVHDANTGTASDSFVLTVNPITCYAPPTGMVSWYSAENNANDIYGTNNGTEQGGVTYAPGKVGQAFDFTGASGGAVSAPFGPGVFPSSANGLTIDAWIKLDAIHFVDGIVSAVKDDAPGGGANHTRVRLMAYVDPNNSARGGVSANVQTLGPGGYDVGVSSAFVLSPNRWHHIAMTAAPNSPVKIYADGVLVGTGDDNVGAALPTDVNRVFIGSGEQATVFNTDGRIDEVEIFDRVLGDSEIAGIYNASTAGKCHTSTLQFSSATYSAGEGDGTKTITVTRTGAHDSAASVHYMTADGSATGGASCGAGVDYQTTSGTLNFMAGDVSQTFNVPICDDLISEGDETVNLSLDTPTGTGVTLGAPNTATLTINDNEGTPSLSVDDPTFTGANSLVAQGFTVTLSHASTQTVMVHYATSNDTAIAGDDYTAASGTLTFNPGDTSKPIPITILADNVNEPQETFFIDLDTPVNATILDGHGIGTIPNDDPIPSMTISDVTKVEGDSGSSSVTFTVTLSNPSSQIVFAQFNTANGSATGGADYTTSSGAVTVNPNQMTGTFTVPVTGDIPDEGNETFFVNLTNPNNATIGDATAVCTIIDDDINSGDFDGDGKNDPSVFRPNADNAHYAKWYILNSGDNSVIEQQFGNETDIPVAGDYNGDGRKEIAVFRPNDDGMNHNAWYISQGSSQNFARIEWGLNGDIPVPADYDGDGKTDVAVFRPSETIWYVLKSSDNQLLAVQWGLSSDRLVPADYDGDGKADIAVWRPSQGTWYIFKSTTNSLLAVQWGLSIDKLVPADYDLDGKADIAVWRPSDGTWYILKSTDGQLLGVPWGTMGDIPVAGDYDGDGKADIAVWRPSLGDYFILESSGNRPAVVHTPNATASGLHWGQGGDVPVASKYIPEQ